MMKINQRTVLSLTAGATATAMALLVYLTRTKGSVDLQGGTLAVLGPGYEPSLVMLNKTCFLFWRQKAGGWSGPLNPIEQERGLHFDLLSAARYDPNKEKLSATRSGGGLLCMSQYAIAPPDASGLELLVTDLYSDVGPYIGWTRCEITDSPEKADRLDRGLTYAINRPRNWTSGDGRSGIVASGLSDSVWGNELGRHIGTTHCAWVGENLVVLYGTEISRASPGPNAARAWVACSTDSGRTWLEAAPAVLGQSPQLILLDGTGKALLLVARPVSSHVSFSKPGGWCWWEPYGPLRRSKGENRTGFLAPRYPCPIVLCRGNVLSGKWSEGAQVLKGWRALELGVYADGEGVVWLAFNRGVGNLKPVSRVSERQDWPQDRDLSQEPLEPILRPDLPHWSDHPQKQLPTHPLTQVMLCASRDEGKTWTEPLPISDGKGSDWQPQVARVQDKVLVAWTRASPEEMNVCVTAVAVDKVLQAPQHVDLEIKP